MLRGCMFYKTTRYLFPINKFYWDDESEMWYWSKNWNFPFLRWLNQTYTKLQHDKRCTLSTHLPVLNAHRTHNEISLLADCILHFETQSKGTLFALSLKETISLHVSWHFDNPALNKPIVMDWEEGITPQTLFSQRLGL